MSMSLKDDILNAVRDSKIDKVFGIKTPEFRKPTPPPPVPNPPRRFCRNVIDTKEQFDKLTERPDDLIRMDGAEVYFSVKSGLTAIITTQEWKDYFMGKSNFIPNTKENNND